MERLWLLVGDGGGEDTIEYALVLGLVSLIALSIIIATGQDIRALWVGVCQSISQASGGAVPCS